MPDLFDTTETGVMTATESQQALERSGVDLQKRVDVVMASINSTLEPLRRDMGRLRSEMEVSK